MLKIRPLDTILTAFDYPFRIDVEIDPVPATLEVYIPPSTVPYTSITLNQRYSRVTVWSENPIASTPTNQVHTIKFVLVETGETITVDIAYFSTSVKMLSFTPERGAVFYTRVTRTMIIGDKMFYNVISGANVHLLNAPDNTKAFIELYGENDLGDKFYYVDRQDRILTAMGAGSTLNVTLRAFKDFIPVSVYYDIAGLGTLYRFTMMARSFIPSVIAGFLTDVGARIAETPIAVAKHISKLLGLNINILGATVEGGRLKVVYAVDAPPLLLIALGFVAGATIALYISGTIRDVIALAETWIVMNTLEALARERSIAILKALEYAQSQGLTFEQTRELVRNIMEQYDTGDVINALEARNKVTELESQVGSLKTQRLILGATAIGAGALAVLALRGRS